MNFLKVYIEWKIYKTILIFFYEQYHFKVLNCLFNFILDNVWVNNFYFKIFPLDTDSTSVNTSKVLNAIHNLEF